MKNKILKLASALCLTLALTSFTHRTTLPDGTAPDVKAYSVKELKEAYGNNIVVEGNIDLNALTEVTVLNSTNPCAGTGLMPCGAAEAKARAYAQHLANQCCCTVVFGWECCDPGTGSSYAVLFLTEPKNCN